MVIILDPAPTAENRERVRDFLVARGFRVREIESEGEIVLGAAGFSSIDMRELEAMPGVRQVIPITKPYKLASREMQREDSVVQIGGIKVGGRRIAVIAGPCSVESRDQIIETARLVRASGAVMLRGGAFKPRTSPYSFQGLGEVGLGWLKEAGELTGMPIVTEIVSPEQVAMMLDYVDLFQIGARNMQNYELLKQVGSTGRPVLLKRGHSATIEEWLMASEYLLAHGTEDLILCERGIRTFENYTRFSLDISSIPVVHDLSHLPIIVDPSHATGLRDKVAPVALAAIAAGANGLMVEVHPFPDKALSDGKQSIYPAQFERLMRDIEAMAPVVEKELLRLPETGGGDPSFAGMGLAEGAENGVAFQGSRGAYSDMALRRFFQSDSTIGIPCAEFRDVFASVLNGRCRYGIVPLENSLSGSIHENYDLLLQFPDVLICGEIRIRIIHSLIGCPGATLDEIESVFSHPQGLAQCARFLDRHPHWKRIPYYDTAGSVDHIATLGDRGCAAIASSETASVYRMQVLHESIETNPNNYTRFVVLAREEAAQVDRVNKGSIVFSTHDSPGALSACMQLVANHGLNLTKIESRPILGRPWNYMFYLDIEVPAPDTPFYAALDDLRIHTEDLRILGLYHGK